MKEENKIKQSKKPEKPPYLDELVKSLSKNAKSFFVDSRLVNREIKEAGKPRGGCVCVDEKQLLIAEVSFKCHNCQATHWSKLFSKPYRIAALIAFASYGSSQFIDYAITDNRYPLVVEYEVLNAHIYSQRKVKQ